MNADGSSQARLTTNARLRRLAVLLARLPEDRLHQSSRRRLNFEIYSMNADGSAQTRLTNNPAYDLLATFSPNGQKIAFASTRDGNLEIYTINADGSAPTRLTNNAAADAWPAFSPDGQKIAFASTRDGNDEIYTINADGSSPARLTNNSASGHLSGLGGGGHRGSTPPRDHDRLRSLRQRPTTRLPPLAASAPLTAGSRSTCSHRYRQPELRPRLGPRWHPHPLGPALEGPYTFRVSGRRDPASNHRSQSRHGQLQRRHPGPQRTVT